MAYDSPYIKNYEFIPFTEPHYYSAGNEKKYSGYIVLKIICDSDVYIGSGYRDFIGGGKDMVCETIKKDGKPVIPGSSLKGVIRHIASAVSDSCLPRCKVRLPAEQEKWKGFTCRAADRKLCVVCDMFGTMGWGSKITFPEFTSENASTHVRNVNAQFTPSKIKKYDDDDPGYKFYYAEDWGSYEASQKIIAEFIKKGSVFGGKVFFERLTQKQLELLMFSCGMDRSFHLKIGGFKNDGFGEVHIEAVEFNCSGLDIPVDVLADNYYNEAMNADCRASVEHLVNILGVSEW